MMNGLWPHQQRVSDLLSEGKSVILQAPTGSGKTRAALDYFLFQLMTPPNRSSFPRRCIYSVPMRVLAKQFYREYADIVHRYNKRFNLETQVTAKTQTGEQPEDPELTANLIFATIDQTLSSYLLSPYSLGKRMANVNAGAVLSSYLVFDEFHLYDPASMLPTTLLMLKMLKGITPFVLMTATFSTVMLEELGKLLDASVFPLTYAEKLQLENLPSQQKQREYRVAQQPLSARAVLETHDSRSLVICNTVDRARRLYDDVLALTPADTELILLHSRFLSSERNAIEDRIRRLFGKDADREAGRAIVIATQAIEVGVDMSCTVLHTELAPANAVIQRAGRCARYANEVGTVYLYSHTLNPDDPTTPLDLTDPDYAAPYKTQAALFPATLDAFRGRQGVFRFSDEQAVIAEVHNELDARMLRDLRAEARGYASRMFAVQRGDGDTDVRSLVREIQQQNLIVHADPQSLLHIPSTSPLELPAFGLHPGTLAKYVRQWMDQANALDAAWSVKMLHDYGAQKDSENAAQSNEDRYDWHDIRSVYDLISAPLVVVNPLLATYDPVRGFVPDQGGDWQTPIPEPKTGIRPKRQYTYRLETYAQHIRHVYDAFLENWWEADWAAKRLEAHFGWHAGSVRRAAELAVLLHDVGKLSVGWQGWVRDYQHQLAVEEDDIGLEVQPGEAYAHTYRQTPRHAEIEHRMPKRPWHAVEGTISVSQMMFANLANDELAAAALAAIARHHSPYSTEYKRYRLVRNASQHIAATFKGRDTIQGLSDLLLDDIAPEATTDLFPNPDGDDARFLAYLLLVRALRRADVAGTRAGNLKR